MNKEMVRKLTRHPLVRLPVRAAMAAAALTARVASVLRAGVLFPTGPAPVCHWTVTVKFPENITLGQGVVIEPKTVLGAKGGLTLGDHVRISEGVMIETAGLDFSGPPPYSHIARPIVIERSVWIGARAIILGGVTLGEKSVIGAGAAVTRSVAPGSIIAGPRATARNEGSVAVHELKT